MLAIPQDATALANRGPYGNILFAPGWTDPVNDVACREWPRTMALKTKAELERRATAENAMTGVGEYANYDSVGEPAQVLSGQNAPRLRELKKKYDPENVFRSGLLR